MEIEVKEEGVLDSLIIKEEPAIQEQPYYQSGNGYVFKEESMDNFMKTEFPDEFAKSEDPDGFMQFEITEVNQAPVQRVAAPRRSGKANNYQCVHCPETFDRKWTLETHMYTHLKVLILKCTKCRKTFKKPELLRQHIKKCLVQHHKCLVCNGNFTASCASSGHVRSVGRFNNLPFKSYKGYQSVSAHQSRLFECTVCQELFRSVKQLKTHKLEHWHRCPYCERIFAKLKSAEMHISKDHRGLPFNPTLDPPSCTICKKKCRSFERLRKHVMMHNIEKVFQCGSCKNIFATVIDIEDHVVNEHEGLTLPPGFPEVWTVYRCFRTGKTFPAVLRVLNNVEELPAKDAPRMKFQCPDCKERFLNQKLLDQHMLVDQPPFKKPQEPKEDEIFQCRVCGVVHTSQTSLESHEKQHNFDERVNALYLWLKKAKTATAAPKTGEHSRVKSRADRDYILKIK